MRLGAAVAVTLPSLSEFGAQWWFEVRLVRVCLLLHHFISGESSVLLRAVACAVSSVDGAQGFASHVAQACGAAMHLHAQPMYTADIIDSCAVQVAL